MSECAHEWPNNIESSGCELCGMTVREALQISEAKIADLERNNKAAATIIKNYEREGEDLRVKLEAIERTLKIVCDGIDYLLRERDDLQRQVEKLTGELNNTNMINDDLLKTFGKMEDDHREDCANAARFANELDDAYSTIAQMREALEYYAKPENYGYTYQP